MIVAAITIGAAILAILNGMETAASVIGGTTVVSLEAVFITGRQKNDSK